MAKILNRDGKLSDNSVRIIRQQSLFQGHVSRDDVAALCNEVTRLREIERNVIKLWNGWGETEEDELDQLALWEDFGRALSIDLTEPVAGVL